MMTISNDRPGVPQPMKINVTDRGETVEVSNVNVWIEERRQLLRRARDLLTGYDGNPASLYEHHAALVEIVARLAQIKAIFDGFNRERKRHADTNIAALVKYFNDPNTLEGIDD
jgi:hypothetical protein